MTFSSRVHRVLCVPYTRQTHITRTGFSAQKVRVRVFVIHDNFHATISRKVQATWRSAPGPHTVSFTSVRQRSRIAAEATRRRRRIRRWTRIHASEMRSLVSRSPPDLHIVMV